MQAKGLIGGWSVEPQEHESLGQGTQGKAFVVFVGWPSVQAHMEFRDTEEFANMIGLLRGGAVGMKMAHVGFREVQ